MHPRILRGLGACALAMSLLWASPAAAFSVSLTNGADGEILRWPTQSMTYYLHPACSEDLPEGECLDTLRASFAAWTGHACSGATFTDQGASNNLSLTSTGGSSNGKNELAFIEGNDWQLGSYVLGVTGPSFGFDGFIVEADIAFNGLHHTWRTDGASGSTDVMNVAVHEIGHYFGLSHVLTGYSMADPPTMAPAADPNMGSRTPEADDVQGLCFLYSQGDYSCGSDEDCPWIVENSWQGESYVAKLPCEGGLCGGAVTDLPQGSGTQGDTCSQDYDCAEPYICDKSPWGGGVCAQPCESSLDCPEGLTCSGGVCEEEGGGGWGGGGGLEEGDPCTSGGGLSCPLPLVCVDSPNGSFCRQGCASFLPCPSDHECVSIGFGGFGGCVPLESAPFGAPCDKDGDCDTGICEEGLCSTSCSVFDGDGACDGVMGCARSDVDDPEGLCTRRGEEALGGDCEKDLACDSLLCHAATCRQVCDPSAEASGCPEGIACEVAAGPIGYCDAPTGGGTAGAVQPTAQSGVGCGASPARPAGVLLMGLLLIVSRRRLATRPIR